MHRTFSRWSPTTHDDKIAAMNQVNQAHALGGMGAVSFKIKALRETLTVCLGPDGPECP